MGSVRLVAITETQVLLAKRQVGGAIRRYVTVVRPGEVALLGGVGSFVLRREGADWVMGGWPDQGHLSRWSVSVSAVRVEVRASGSRDWVVG